MKPVGVLQNKEVQQGLTHSSFKSQILSEI